MAPLPPPNLNIPPSSSTVSVSAINTTSTLHGGPTSLMVSPPIQGHNWLAAPIYSFLIHHPPTNRRLLFDLGIRKDFQNLSPVIYHRLQEFGCKITVTKDVRDILEENGLATRDIEAVVWSHHHFDHTGDMTRFGSQTKLIVGPEFREKMLPGYPANPSSTILESDYEGRELEELDFQNGKYKTLKIGRFGAVDYFGDGSFYLLDSPGHTVGHLCALARVQSDGNKSSFVFLAGDSFHHPGEIRPSRYLPIPESIQPSPFSALNTTSCCGSSCPGSIFDEILKREGRPEGSAFYSPARLGENSFHHDVDELEVTVGKVQEADCQDDIFVCAAHDESLLDVVEFFPEGTLNDFTEKGLAKKARWRFLSDFGRAVGRECDGEVKHPNDKWAV
ncbi:beta-lactamase-like protein [Cladorrhinum sp. PSN259]|nr:beta-lactamase-like protein [Cladorrhinum sp. PSN259]